MIILEKETLFYWIAFGLGIGAVVIAILSITILSDYQETLTLFQLLTIILLTAMSHNPVI
ncbi:MAG: hypothetical protein ACTSO9_20015 [Candidatus Helarchaeota archaeon]